MITIVIANRLEEQFRDLLLMLKLYEQSPSSILISLSESFSKNDMTIIRNLAYRSLLPYS